MKIYIKKYYKQEWEDISDYRNGDIVLNLQPLDEGKLELVLDDTFTYFDYTEPMPPKMFVRITRNDKDYYFRSTDSSTAIIRESEDSFSAVYDHLVDLVDYTYTLSDRVLPSYTITQRKGYEYNKYRRKVYFNNKIDFKYQLDGESYDFPSGTHTDISYENADASMIYSLDSNTYQIHNIDKENYNITFSMSLKTSAIPTFVSGATTFYYLFSGMNEQPNSIPTTNVNVTYLYYNENNNLIDEKNKSVYVYTSPMNSNNNIVDKSVGPIIEYEVVGMPNEFSKTDEVSVFIPRNENAKYVKVIFSLLSSDIDVKHVWARPSDRLFGDIPTNIQGYNNNSYVKAEISNTEVTIVSQMLDHIPELSKTTYLDLVEKALHDYNFNREEKVTLSEETRMLLESVVAKEGEFSNYNLYELLVRVFESVGAIPKLDYLNNEIYHITQKQRALQLDYYAVEKQIDNETFYSKITTYGKNIMSENSFIRETLTFGSVSSDVQELRSDNPSAGFKTSQPIYFISDNVILTVPDVTVNITDGTDTVAIKGNTGTDYKWKINERLLEKDIFDALPNVRLDTKKNETIQKPSLRATGELGQGNVLYYKSGERGVSNAFHLAPSVPEYDLLTGATLENVAEFAMLEMIICLAYEEAMRQRADFANAPYKLSSTVSGYSSDRGEGMNVISNSTLEIEYCPIYEELSASFVTDRSNKVHTQFEKVVNVNNKVVSYEETENVLVNEMDNKGGLVKFSEIDYDSVDDVIPLNTKLNDGFTVTSIGLILSDNYVNAHYRVEENYALFSDDVGLETKYERYLVPYEYVNREIEIDNHLIFSNESFTHYALDERGCEVSFLEDLFRNGFNKDIYATYDLNYNQEPIKRIVMRMGALQGRKTTQLVGMFSDNYSAGSRIVRVATSSDTPPLVMSIPYRYTDIEGRVETIDNFSLGERLMLAKRGASSIVYEPHYFPLGIKPDDPEYKTVILRPYFSHKNPVLLGKDARESLVINHKTYFNSTNDIKVLNIGEITGIGYQNELGENIVVSSVDSSGITVGDISNNGFRVHVDIGEPGDPIPDYEKVVLFGSDIRSGSTNFIPMIEINNPNYGSRIKDGTIESYYVYFYVYTTRYGRKE